MEVKQISINEVKFVSYKIACEFLGVFEPIPAFETRYKGVLESCLSQPFQQISGNDLYPSLLEKGATLFYLLVKNHPFLNGNKRIAVITLYLFLHKNGYWLSVTQKELYDLALSTARRTSVNTKRELKKIQKFLELNVVKRKIRSK